MAGGLGTTRYTGMQSATLTVSRSPRVLVAWPSTPSTIIHPDPSRCQRTRVWWIWKPRMVARNPGSAWRNRRQRAMTSPTGASVPRPRSNSAPVASARPVMPATTP